VNPVVTILNTPFVQLALPIVVTLIVGIWANNKRSDDIGKRLDDFAARLGRIEDRLTGIETRLTAVERKVDGLEVKAWR
jgi:hypothetical protein